ncbi:MAG: glycosyltransferase family 2 protein [Anaerolineaceae bacterium]|nr:glycosyltransferase family 2 protein [Anaerolineaceae bacterium]
MTPACSIVIRAYNEEKHIGKLLTGISHQTVKDVQVILVDSGSTDRTAEIARSFGVEIVNIKPDDFSFGRSLNLGISHARSEYVVIASAHVYPVYPDWLERLLEPFEDAQVALVYGKQRGMETTHFSEHQIFHHWFPDQSSHRQTHPFCNNANSAIRRSVWEQHPYNENLPALEDLAWARWAHDQGLGIAYIAEAEIIHVHNEIWKGIYNRYRREGMAFKQIYPQENFRWTDLFRLWTGNVVSDWRMAARQGLLQGNLTRIVRFRWNQFLGTYHGYHQSGPLTWKLKQAFYYPRDLAALSPQALHRNVDPIRYSNTHPNEDDTSK